MNLFRLGIVGSMFLVGVLVGCQEEPKFTIPDDPAPWSPDLQPSSMGSGGGGGGQRGSRSKDKDAEKDSKAAPESNKVDDATNNTGSGDAKESENTSEATQQDGTDEASQEKQGDGAKASETQGAEGVGEGDGQL
jgi:hypothetical protein